MGTITINGKKYEFTNEKNVLTIIRNAGIEVPTLCYQPELSIFGACRLCSADADDAVGSDGKMPPGQFFRKGCDILRHTAFAAVQINIVVGAALHFGK